MTWDPELPPVTSETQGWWDATRERRLTVQRCQTCGQFQHYPRSLCRRCGSLELELVVASGRGTVVSYTDVHRSPDPDRFEPPYTLALVRLEEGPILLTRLVNGTHAGCDKPVAVDWHPLPDGRHLPVFSLLDEELGAT